MHFVGFMFYNYITMHCAKKHKLSVIIT